MLAFGYFLLDDFSNLRLFLLEGIMIEYREIMCWRLLFFNRWRQWFLFELLVELLRILSMDSCRLLGKYRCSWDDGNTVAIENILENVERPILFALDANVLFQFDHHHPFF